MDRKAYKIALVEALEELAAQKEGAEKIVVKLTQQIWRFDSTVPASDIISNYLKFDLLYFYNFMMRDFGDEGEEKQLLKDWIDEKFDFSKNRRFESQLFALVDELDDARDSVNKVEVT